MNIAKKKPVPRVFDGVKVEKVFDCQCAIRALSADKNHVFFAGSKGKFGYLNTADNSLAYSGTIKRNGKNPPFRALAKTMEKDFILSAGNPALLYRVNFFGKRKLLYKQGLDGTFYDAMAFWNPEEGLAIGDPVDGCMSFLITRNSGRTWSRIPCRDLPKAEDGEAAFAASNSNIAIVGDKAWVISGGMVSRVYYSPDKGRAWTVQTTPLTSGKPTTGGYSIAFYNEKLGIIYGGDYTNPKNDTANIALTTNGGKTWKLIASGNNLGYKSCVRFVPGSNGNEIVAVGPTGIAYSNDRGKTWTQLSDKGFLTIDFLNGFVAYAAGKGKIAKLTFMEQSPQEMKANNQTSTD